MSSADGVRFKGILIIDTLSVSLLRRLSSVCRGAGLAISVLASVVRLLSARMLPGEANICVGKASGLAVDSALGF